MRARESSSIEQIYAICGEGGGEQAQNHATDRSSPQAKMLDKLPGYAPIELVGLNRADELDIVIDQDSVLTIKLATCSYTSRGVEGLNERAAGRHPAKRLTHVLQTNYR
jgi:hypothetical protein